MAAVGNSAKRPDSPFERKGEMAHDEPPVTEFGARRHLHAIQKFTRVLSQRAQLIKELSDRLGEKFDLRDSIEKITEVYKQKFPDGGNPNIEFFLSILKERDKAMKDMASVGSKRSNPGKRFERLERRDREARAFFD